VIWRIVPDAGADQRMLVVESAGGHIEPPKRYINNYGQFLESAPYAERDIRPPDALVTHDETGEFEVRVKARGQISRYIYSHHPLDVVGWDGHLWPFAFNIRDFEPITGRVHQPPPVHQTFDGPGFVVCSFVPRLFDYHPLSIPAPYNHSNVDSDEVIYYVEGDFMSRRGVGARLPASQRHPPRSSPWNLRGIDRQDAHRRARRHGRYVPSVEADHAGGGVRRRAVPVQLVEITGGVMAGKNFVAFKETIEHEFMGHPVVKKNEYTAWFAHGDMPIEHLRQFTIQFSVFSNQFLLAALNRAINADTLHAARESKEILMNELGVIYNKVDKPGAHADPRGSADSGHATAIAKAIRPGSDRGNGRRREVSFPGGAHRVAAPVWRTDRAHL
jgi:hypothetical protein